MNTMTFDTIDMVLLALIGVATPLIFLVGILLAYRTEQRGSAKSVGERRKTQLNASEGHRDSHESYRETPVSAPPRVAR